MNAVLYLQIECEDCGQWYHLDCILQEWGMLITEQEVKVINFRCLRRTDPSKPGDTDCGGSENSSAEFKVCHLS